MYVPAHFALTENDEIIELMRSGSFATLVASSNGVPLAAHLPIEIVEHEGGAPGVIGHMARANPLWQAARGAAEVLVIFGGPHAYVSPTWYEQPSVPTWNYSAVHLYGRFRLVEGQDELYALLRRLVARHEAANAARQAAATAGRHETSDTASEPFDLAQLPRSQVDGMMQGIVGFEVVPTRLEAVAKLSQNRSDADRRSVVAHLVSRGDDASRLVAAAMTRLGSPPPLNE